MKKTTVNAITFAQANNNKKAVVSDKYVAHALYTQNKPIWEALGGTRIEGEKGLYIEFKSVKDAKAFISQAITSISEKDYNKARKSTPKTEPKPKVEKKASAPVKAKGKVEYVSVTLDDGTKVKVKKSDLVPMDKPTKKGKGNSKPTTAPNTKASKSVKAKAEPKKAKGNCKVDFSALAGKGRAANKDAAALMRKAGLTDGTSAEYKAVWAEWCKVR